MNKIIIGNLKMNLLSLSEVNSYLLLFNKELSAYKPKGMDIIICAPAIYLKNFQEGIRNKCVAIGAQNVFWEKEGSYTGEISAPMLKNLGIEYVVIGHSERRQYFSETNGIINLKIKSALKWGLKPIYCIGETRLERDNDLTKKIITEQILAGLEGVSLAKIEKVIIAYEPVWSVGTDIVPTANEIMEAKILIKKILIEKYGSKNVKNIPILYGGSVSEKTVDQLAVEPAMDGVFIGRESLLPHELFKIANIITRE